MYIVVFYMMTDNTRSVLKGTTKAMGLYQQVMAQNLVCSWVVMGGLSYYFAFALDMGLFGIWLAKLISDSLVSVCYTKTLSDTNWYVLAQKEHDRMFN